MKLRWIEKTEVIVFRWIFAISTFFFALSFAVQHFMSFLQDYFALLIAFNGVIWIVSFTAIYLYERHYSEKIKSEELNRRIESDRERLESLLNSINEMVFFLDEKLHFTQTWTSSKYSQFFPTNQLIGLFVSDGLGPVLAEQLIPSILKCQETSLPQNKEICIEESSRTWWNFKIKKILIQKLPVIMINVYDVTVERKMREELDQQKNRAEASARLAGLGEMAAGIAHEINNPLAIVAGYSQNLRKHIRAENLEIEKIDSIIDKILHATDRASGIVKSMQKLARQQRLDPDVGISIREIFHEALVMLQSKLKYQPIPIDLICEFDEVSVLGRSGEIMQIFINLISNSIDAVADIEGAWIKVQVVREEREVFIKFIDSGYGIPNAFSDKVMQPFFTTKAPNKGTGLGLSISSTLAKNNEGELYLDSSARNTTFVLKLKKIEKKSIPKIA